MSHVSGMSEIRPGAIDGRLICVSLPSAEMALCFRQLQHPLLVRLHISGILPQPAGAVLQKGSVMPEPCI